MRLQPLSSDVTCGQAEIIWQYFGKAVKRCDLSGWQIIDPERIVSHH